MPTLRISQNDRGRTVLTNGTLNALNYERGPANGFGPGPRIFTLVDDGVAGLPARVIYSVDLSNSPFLIPSIPDSVFSNFMISNDIPYVAVTVQNIPDGSSFVIEYT
jgi:hypothetical protein